VRHPIRLAALAAAATTLAVTAGITSANGSTAEGVTTSSATISQSEVPGSSPTSLGQSPLAKTPAGRAAAAAAAVATPLGTTTSYETVVSYDPATGKVLARHRYGQRFEGKRVNPYRVPVLSGHGTGGTSTAAGCNKVTITMKRTTFTGTFAAKFQVWTDWCWTRSNQVVDVNRYFREDDEAPGYHYNGLAYPPEHFYYDFSVNDGHPKSAFWHEEEGLFSGPTGDFAGGGWSPQITLASYYNGTNQWWTSD
jgi:hypothetical protein